MEHEEWRAVERFPCYEVSNRGRVRRITYKSPYLNEWGYPTVQLFKGDGKHATAMIHRLVAEAFIPNPQNFPEVNHADGNKLNFQPENLDWCTRQENRQHAALTGLNVVGHGEKAPHHKLTDAQVIEIRSLDGKMKQRDIAKKFGVTQYAIWCVVNRATWAHIKTDAPPDNRREPGNAAQFKAGESHPLSKLTETDVRAIRAQKGIKTQSELAQRFGVHEGTIQNIMRGKTWKHVN